jgi:hypothetical protein
MGDFPCHSMCSQYFSFTAKEAIALIASTPSPQPTPCTANCARPFLVNSTPELTNLHTHYSMGSENVGTYSYSVSIWIPYGLLLGVWDDSAVNSGCLVPAVEEVDALNCSVSGGIG